MPSVNEIQAKFASAFSSSLAGAVKTFTYTSADNEPTYDPDTGVTSSDISYTGLTGAFVDFTVKEISALNTVLTRKEKVRPTDVNLIVLQNVLLVEPKKGDKVAVSNGRTYEVISWKEDPLNIQYQLQLRTMKDA